MTQKPDLALSDTEWTIVHDILAQHLAGYQVWAFGSRAKFTHKPFSDLDIVIMGDQPLGFSAKTELREAFDESDLRWKVDIVDWHDLAEDFRWMIDTHKIRLQ